MKIQQLVTTCLYSDRWWLPWHDRGGIFLEDINAWWERRLICIKNYGPFLIFFVSSSSPVCLLINMHKKLWHNFFWFFTVFSFLVLYGFGDVASLYIGSYWILYSFSWYDMIWYDSRLIIVFYACIFILLVFAWLKL